MFWGFKMKKSSGSYEPPPLERRENSLVILNEVKNLKIFRFAQDDEYILRHSYQFSDIILYSQKFPSDFYFFSLNTMKIELHHIKVKDLVDQYQDDAENGVVGYHGKLDIRPPYQREFVYKEQQRNAVIETLRKNFPLNVMYRVVRED